MVLIDDSSYRLNVDLGKKDEIHHYSYKEHLKISKIAKFGRETLSKCGNDHPVNFANFVCFRMLFLAVAMDFVLLV